MALPKRKQSKSRGRKRRTHLKSYIISSINCPQDGCGEKMRPHHACTKCGYYRDRQVIVAIKK